MASLTSWVISVAGPVVKKALTQLGVGVVAYQGVEMAANALVAQARASWSGMPADVLQLMAISGVNTALGIVVGGIMARISLTVLKRFQLK